MAAFQVAREARQAKIMRARSAAAAYLGGSPRAAALADQQAEEEEAAAAAAAQHPPTWWEPSGLDALDLLMDHPVSTSGAGGRGATSQKSPEAAGVVSATGQWQAARAAARSPQSRPASGLPRTAGARRQTANFDAAATARRGATPSAPAGARPGASAAGAVPDGPEARQARHNRSLLARLLRADTPRRLASAFSTLGNAKASSVVGALAAIKPGGLQAAALLLESLPPVTASRLVIDSHYDGSPALLPAELRAQLLPLLCLKVRENLKAAAVAVAAAAARRSAEALAVLRVFGWGRCVSCAQLVAVLRLLGPGVPEDRCNAVVTLWSKVVDRGNMVEVSLYGNADEGTDHLFSVSTACRRSTRAALTCLANAQSIGSPPHAGV
jgi:hypothetical protein